LYQDNEEPRVRNMSRDLF